MAFTPAQQEAIAHITGPLLVTAGPGSGKTAVITYRVAYLTRMAGVDPSTLLIVTFTKAAADEMKARTAQVAGPVAASRATFGTFHALAYRLLKHAEPERKITVLEESAQFGLIRQLMRSQRLNIDDETIQDVLSDLTRLRADVEPPPRFQPRSLEFSEFDRLREGYRQAKERRGVMDFDDLLHDAYGMLQHRPDVLEAYRRRYAQVMIDEFQDTSPIQWELIRLLAEPRHNLFAVGDEDQSIYGWRGASPRFLLEFQRAYPAAVRVTLDVNHRCPPAVVTAANHLIGWNRGRLGKVIKPVKQGGAPVSLLTPADSLREAEAMAGMIKQAGRPFSDWVIIYRTNQQAHAIARVLDRASIPYRALGGLPNLFKRWPVQDVLCYLRAACGAGDALTQVINRPNRYVSRATLQEAERLCATARLDILSAIAQTGHLKAWQLRPLEELSDHIRRLSRMTAAEAIGYVRRIIGYDDYILDYCARAGGTADEILALLSEVEANSPNEMLMKFLAEVDSSAAPDRKGGSEEAVTLVTCHRAKGLEFPLVVVAGVIDKLMPVRGATDLEEERRLLYVAMTRTLEQLWLSAPKAYGGREATPSPFLAEAQGQSH